MLALVWQPSKSRKDHQTQHHATANFLSHSLHTERERGVEACKKANLGLFSQKFTKVMHKETSVVYKNVPPIPRCCLDAGHRKRKKSWMHPNKKTTVIARLAKLLWQCLMSFPPIEIAFAWHDRSNKLSWTCSIPLIEHLLPPSHVCWLAFILRNNDHSKSYKAF
jgi:hypothetical protein